MKLIDAIKNEKGNPYWIPDCSRNDLPEFFKELGFKTGVEIGVALGNNLEQYCKAGLKMYGVDAWTNEPDGIFINHSNVTHPCNTVEEVYDVAVKKLSKYSNCTLIRKRSFEALSDFPNNSLDFVYIDGNHMYGYTAMDLMAWTSKVKKGGVIAGHDYCKSNGRIPRTSRGVKYAVDGFVKTFDVDNWYILNSVPDQVLSYMIFKHW